MSKYNARKTQASGRVFDSKAEARRYRELTLLLQVGEITDIECQPKFLLQEGYKKNGKSVRPIYYIADFKVKYADGREEIEDVKSSATKTPLYKLKKKMFEKLYPYTIKEIM